MPPRKPRQGRVQEVLSRGAELERERAAKAALTVEGDRLRRELGDLRQRLREAQRAEHATAQALAKAEVGCSEARRTLPDPESTPTSPPSIVVVVDTFRP